MKGRGGRCTRRTRTPRVSTSTRHTVSGVEPRECCGRSTASPTTAPRRSRGDYAPAAGRLHDDYLHLAGGETPAVPGLWCGEAGILLVADRMAPDSARADRLLEVVCANAANETNELDVGRAPGRCSPPGVMLARTGDERWAKAWAESADRLWAEWRRSEELGCHLWTQRLYGDVARYLGPAHGFAGSVVALAQLATQPRRDELVERATETVAQPRVPRGRACELGAPCGRAAGETRQGIRVQWCHGAPGMVALAGVAAAADQELDALLVAGGELTWTAGPLAKGAGLCHGTAGNGYALLALHGRTGDPVWLDARAGLRDARARAGRSGRGPSTARGRFSLWTGDLGAAVFAWQCIDGAPGFPTIDTW